jgi:endonuclease/exonuclease/phosphatase family metal-dependent hydrolase
MMAVVHEDHYAPTPTVFISYRRDDSGPSAGRLYDSLVEEFGADCVFKDVDAISAGENFEAVIIDALSRSTVVVAVIGPQWRGSRGPLRRPRIWDEADWVRRELQLARDRRIAIVPVLVHGAPPLGKKYLPKTIQYLATLHAPSLRDDRWGDDMKSFTEELKDAHQRLLDEPTAVLAERHNISLVSPQDNRRRLLFLGIAISLLLCFLAFVFWPINWSIATLVEAIPTSESTIDVGFWNIEHFYRADEDRIQKVANVLTELDLDVCGLIEVSRDVLESLKKRFIAKDIPADYVLQDTRTSQDIALFFRRDRVQCARDDSIYMTFADKLNEADPESGSRIFPRKPLFVRCTSARLKAPFLIGVVHFKAMRDADSRRRRQLASVVIGEIVSDSGRAIIGGDFNATPSEALKAFGGLKDVGGLTPLFHVSASPQTWIGNDTMASSIDHIWASIDLPIERVGSAASLVIELDRTVPNYTEDISDHRPIAVRLHHEK